MDRRWGRRLALVTGLALVLGVVAVGTLLVLGRASRGGTTHSSSSAATPAAAPAATSGGAATTAATPRCHTSDLTAQIRALSPGAGQRYAAVDLVNASGHACRVYGYVGLLLLDGGRRPVQTTAVWGAPPPTPPIVLNPGQAAFAQLHWTVVPSSPGEQASSCLPAPAFVEITPPDETTPLVIPWDQGGVCLHGTIDVVALTAGVGPPA